MDVTRQSEGLAAREEGRGVPVILLHDSASDSRQWRSLTGYLAGRYQVIAPDLPGYGGSRDAAGGAPSLAGIAEALRPFVVLGTPVHLVGHGFGGAVALKTASLFPGHVRSLTVIEPAAYGALWTGRHRAAGSRALRAAMGSSAACLAEGDAWTAMRIVIEFWHGAGAWDRTSFGLRQRLAADAGRVHRDFAAAAGDRSTALDLAGVVCPVLSLRGASSPPITAAVRDHLRQTLPFMEHREVEGAGHMLPLTDPHIVDPAIGKFLARTDRSWQDENGTAALAA